METIRNRATEALPSVLLTLLSMVQALALELTWSHVRETPGLYALDLAAFIGWTQTATVLLGIIQVWLFYTSLVMRFRWTPSFRDTIVPFVIGVLEFALIDLMGSEYMGLWFATLGMIFAVSVWVSQGIFANARKDPANHEFFARVKPAELRDFARPASSVAALFVLAAVVAALGSTGWPALLALLVAAALIGYEVHLARDFWNLSLGKE